MNTPIEIQQIAQHPQHLDACARIDFLEDLRAMLGGGMALDVEVLDCLCDAAHYWCDWPLLNALASTLLEAGGDPARQHGRLAIAHWHMADSDTALTYSRRALLLAPRNDDLATVHGDIEQWAAFCAHYNCYQQSMLAAGDLQLELLGHHHVDSFQWLYHDPEIRTLCCLPSYHSDTEWHRWLAGEYQQGDELLFAVLHREWGMIGVVSLVLHQGVGFFYYWLGREFRGHGYGPGAVSLLLATAAHCWGLHTCYAQAYWYNRASHGGLHKLGFERLEVSASAPHDDQVFFRRGATKSRQVIARELGTLLVRMGSDTRIATPLMVY